MIYNMFLYKRWVFHVFSVSFLALAFHQHLKCSKPPSLGWHKEWKYPCPWGAFVDGLSQKDVAHCQQKMQLNWEDMKVNIKFNMNFLTNIIQNPWTFWELHLDKTSFLLGCWYHFRSGGRWRHRRRTRIICMHVCMYVLNVCNVCEVCNVMYVCNELLYVCM